MKIEENDENTDNNDDNEDLKKVTIEQLLQTGTTRLKNRVNSLMVRISLLEFDSI